MKALISSEEAVTNFDGTTGYRVADVHETGFEVAQALFWVDCADDVVADRFYYDTSDSTIKPMPVRPRIIGNSPDVIAD
jgi:hypothetical protein